MCVCVCKAVNLVDGIQLVVVLCRGKLRQIMYSCLHQAMYVLGAPSGMIGRLVPVVVSSLVPLQNFCLLLTNCGAKLTLSHIVLTYVSLAKYHNATA